MSKPGFAESVRAHVKNLVLRTSLGFRYLYLHQHGGLFYPKRRPVPQPRCAVLRSQDEVARAVREVREIGLPTLGYGLELKFWDALAAVEVTLSESCRDDRILDAGAEWFSPVLGWLSAYGYRNLHGCNLTFGSVARAGPITLTFGDITGTAYPDDHFKAVTCMSVLEHGVPLEPFFREMRRIVQPSGILVVSVDYWSEPIDTSRERLFDLPWTIFSRIELERLLETAADNGFRLLEPMDPTCSERPVLFNGFQYTFALLSFRRVL